VSGFAPHPLKKKRCLACTWKKRSRLEFADTDLGLRFFVQKTDEKLSPLFSKAGLPDGLFSNQKSQFGYILEGLAMENLGIFYEHLVYLFYGHWKYFMAIWYILW
jgi:hypothetical protein